MVLQFCSILALRCNVSTLLVKSVKGILFHVHNVTMAVDWGSLTLILLTWRIWWASNNASRWQMGLNWAFNVLKVGKVTKWLGHTPIDVLTEIPDMKLTFIHSIGMCRMRRFLAVLRSFYHSSVMYFFLPPFSTNYSSILPLSPHLAMCFFVYLSVFLFQICM